MPSGALCANECLRNAKLRQPKREEAPKMQLEKENSCICNQRGCLSAFSRLIMGGSPSSVEGGQRLRAAVAVEERK
eukprot:1185804-Prorocentrum_minimum.AAC.1